MSSPAPLILLVGMHRSGTSLLGSLLQALGVALPGELIPGDVHNPEGYHERADIIDLQERLLIGLDRWWPGPRGDLPLPPDWLHRPIATTAAARLQAVLMEELARQRGPWAIKDPRTSLLLPLWRRCAAAVGVPLRLILALRDPAEVVGSLCRRDTEAAGMTPWRAQRLWWRHTREVLRHGMSLPLLVIDDAHWFDGGGSEQLRRLAKFCGLPEPSHERLGEALGRIHPEHRHGGGVRPGGTGPALCPDVIDLHRRLSSGTTRPPSASLPRPPRSGLERLRAGRLERRGQRQAPHPPGGWFDAAHYLAQVDSMPRHLDPLTHYRLHGWREGRSPHPLFDPAFYQERCREQGLPLGARPPLDHFLTQGLARRLLPSPLFDPLWMKRQGVEPEPSGPPPLARLHPWGSAALALAGGDPCTAIGLLQHWQHHGLPPDDQSLLHTPAVCPLPWPDEPGDPPGPTHAPPFPFRLETFGVAPRHWCLHGWLERLPLPADRSSACSSDHPLRSCLAAADPALPTVGIGLEDLAELAARPLDLLHRAHLERLYDPDPARVALWRRLGIPAEPLLPPEVGNGWLLQPGDAGACSSALGLPAPSALPEDAILCLGSAGEAWDRRLAAPLWNLPGFDALRLENWEQARLLAGWLEACHRRGLTLVRISPTTTERRAGGWLPIEIFQPPLHPDAVAPELAWRRAGCPPPPAIRTPRPEVQRLHEACSGKPSAAVVVSLHNYADRIPEALESVAAQGHHPLELIVVDDASSDGGARVVKGWMESQGHRFARTLLLEHQRNGGLAAARNTGFREACSPWCFVLDADNALLPDAVSSCLRVASAAPATTAVVHPLVEVEPQGLHRDPRSLISAVSWQRHHFLEGNVIDAMALVRRSAWERVGGYRHIDGGWEDFDFWCLLIEAGFHGVLCPQRLALYRSHGDSMIAGRTDREVRRISRWLQHSHPWLRLPMARPGV